MISSYALSNWDRYLRTTPKSQLGRLPVAGAYDARSGGHGFSRRVYVDDFERGGRLDYRGGAFDAAGDEPESGKDLALLRLLAQRLSPKDWAELQGVLCSEETAEDGLSDQPGYKKNGLPLTALEIAGEDMALATGVGR